MKRCLANMLRLLSLGLVASGTMLAYAEAPGVNSTTGSDDSRWHFGVGTGLSSFSLDGDLGFATSEGGILTSIDLDNSDTSNTIDSAFGISAVATNGPWQVLAGFGTVKLEDTDKTLDAEWERSKTELLVGYQVFQAGNHRFSVLGGVRMIKHEWDIKIRDEMFEGSIRKVDDDWTDLVLGATHVVPINENWAWSNRIDAGFGDTEESIYLATVLTWKPFEHWAFNASARLTKLELGDKSDINDSDFYYYNVDEPAFGIGFMYVW